MRLVVATHELRARLHAAGGFHPLASVAAPGSPGAGGDAVIDLGRAR